MKKRLVMLLCAALLALGSMGISGAAAAMDPSSCLYFAHPMNTYGTMLENRLIERIHTRFPGMRVLNPNDPQYHEGWRLYELQYGNPMLYFTIELMQECAGGTVALPYRDGKWSPGVYLEMMETYVVDRPVWKINADGLISEVNQFPAGLLSIEQNKKYAEQPY